MTNNYKDVGNFHKKFGLQYHDGGDIIELDDETFKFRRDFIQEELDEFVEGYTEGDVAKMFDSLVDLVYVAMGTAHMCNFPWQDGWDEVQRANMSKERASSSDDSRSKRKNSLDVVKPDGWTPPDIDAVLAGKIKSRVNVKLEDPMLFKGRREPIHPEEGDHWYDGTKLMAFDGTSWEEVTVEDG